MKRLCYLIIAVSLQACLAPAILGVKSYQSDHSGNTRIDFITGADFTIGANGIDNVNNNRGIKAKQ